MPARSARIRLSETRRSQQQTVERRAVIDIVPDWQFDDIKAEFACSRPCRIGDAARAPGDVGEQAGVRRLHTEQVVPAIFRRSEHDAIAGLQQSVRGKGEDRCRQCWAVRIQHAGGAESLSQHRLDRVQQATTKALYIGRHFAFETGDAVRQDKPRALGDDAVE